MKAYSYTKTCTWMLIGAVVIATTQMPINKWTDKQIMVFPHSGILISNLKENKPLIHTISLCKK